MEQILFKGQRINNYEWVEGNLHINKDGSCWIKDTDHNVNNGKNNLIPCAINPETVCQYLTNDSYGNKAFNHDIIEVYENCGGTIRPWTAELDFRNGITVVVNRDCCEACKNGYGCICYINEIPGKWRVIGNIYDKQ